MHSISAKSCTIYSSKKLT